MIRAELEQLIRIHVRPEWQESRLEGLHDVREPKQLELEFTR